MKIRIGSDLSTEQSVVLINLIHRLLGGDGSFKGRPLQQLYALERAHNAVSIATFKPGRHQVEIHGEHLTLLGTFLMNEGLMRVQVFNVDSLTAAQRELLSQYTWIEIRERRSGKHVAA